MTGCLTTAPIAKDVQQQQQQKQQQQPPSQENQLYSSQVTFIAYLISFLMTEPEFPKLVTWFKRVPQWQSVCPHLLDDKGGTKTKEISMMHGDVKEKRDEMLERFLGMSDPTWKKFWML